MIKKVLILIMFMLSAALCLLPQPSGAGDRPLVEYQIAAVLMKEARGGGEKSMSFVADVIRTRKLGQRQSITYPDILFQGHFEGSQMFANKSSKALENYWLKTMGESKYTWETALRLAHQVVTPGGVLPYTAQGATNFNTSHGVKNSIFYDEFSNGTRHYFWKEYQGNYNHNSSFWTEDPDDLSGEQPISETPNNPNQGGYMQQPSATNQQGESFDQLSASQACSFQSMKQIYMDETDNANLCWYCNVVIVLMNSFFKGAQLALPAMQSLGRLILKFGFLIWLAYYILQQVSSFAPVTPGKMMQEILTIGFKVALAYAMVDKGGEAIAYYFINPVLSLGIDYGLALFKGLAASSFG